MTHTDPIFKDLHVMPIDKLIHNRIGVFMYKIFYKLQPTIINNMCSILTKGSTCSKKNEI